MTDQTATPAEKGDVVDSAVKDPVESVITEKTDETPTERSDALESDAIEPEKPKKLDPRDKKLAEIAYKERELRRQNARLMAMLEQQQAQAPKPAKPKLEDFGSIEEYTEAALAYAKEADKPKPAQQSNVKADFEVSRDELFANGIAKHPDFEDVISRASITQDMAAAIFELDDQDLQADTAYFLGNNPKESMRITSLSAVKQIAEITRLAAKLEAKRESQVKRPSQAPEPIKPIGGTKTSSDEIQDVEPFESFFKKWRKQRGR